MHRPLALFALAIGSVTAFASERPADTGKLTIHATGFADARGRAVAKLFVAGDNVLGAGRWEVTAPIQGGAADFSFPPLPPGAYAAVVFHDGNGNGRIDHGLLGPSEPLGFSGGFKLSLTSGRPDFDRLKFDFELPGRTLDVRVK